MTREINLAAVKEALMYHLDNKDPILAEKALQAFIYVYNNSQNLDKLLPSVCSPKGKKFFGNKIKIIDGRIFIDEIETEENEIEFSGDLTVDNVKAGSNMTNIKIFGDLKADKIMTGGGLSCGNLEAREVTVGNGLHADDVHAENIHANEVICDKAKIFNDIIVNENVNANSIEILGNLTVNGNLKAENLNHLKSKEQ